MKHTWYVCGASVHDVCGVVCGVFRTCVVCVVPVGTCVGRVGYVWCVLCVCGVCGYVSGVCVCV